MKKEVIDMKTIDSLKPGESAEIIEVKGTGNLRHPSGYGIDT